MGPRRGRVVCSLVALSVAGGLAAAVPETPVAVSPGGPESFLFAGSTCPTFSWAVAGTASPHEVVVHEVVEADEIEMAEQPALRATLPAGATSWTPPLDACLAPDRAYAWVVRAAGAGAETAWSEPRLFRTPAAPTAAELAEILGRLRGSAPEAVAPPPVTTPPAPEPGPAAGAPSRALPPAEAPGSAATGLSGVVVDGDYRYAAGKNRRIFIPGSTFLTTFDDAPDVYRRVNEGYGYLHSGAPPLSVNLQAPVHLPEGAQVYGFTQYTTDLTTTAGVRTEIRLRSLNSSTGAWAETTVSVGDSTGVDEVTCAWCILGISFSRPPIQAGETLFLVVTWQPEVTGNNLRFQGVLISYGVDKAD